jgi:hypothetical protein
MLAINSSKLACLSDKLSNPGLYVGFVSSVVSIGGPPPGEGEKKALIKKGFLGVTAMAMASIVGAISMEVGACASEPTQVKRTL